jgi:hypothetical protein
MDKVLIKLGYLVLFIGIENWKEGLKYKFHFQS